MKTSKEVVLARMISSSDPNIRALAAKLTLLKGWTVEQLYKELTNMAGMNSDSLSTHKK